MRQFVASLGSGGGSVLPPAGDIPDIPILIEIGQSNAGGRAETGRLPEGDYVAAPTGVKYYFKTGYNSTDNGSWVAYDPNNVYEIYPTSRASDYIHASCLHLGQIVQEYWNKDVYVINAGAGGTSLSPDEPPSPVGRMKWAASLTGELLDIFLDDYFDVALSKLPAGTKKVLGIIWHQGETDLTDATATANYTTNLAALITKVRAHNALLNDAPFIITKLNFYQNGDETAFNSALDAFAAANSNVYTIDISDTPRKQDLTVDQKKGVTATAGDDRHTSYLGQIAKAERSWTIIKAKFGY